MTRIDPVGLGQIAHGLGKVAHLASVDDDGGQPLSEQGANGGFLIRTGGLEDDAFGGQGLNPRHEFGDPGGGVGELLANRQGAHMNIQVILGDIDANEDTHVVDLQEKLGVKHSERSQ